ncbi:MAG: LacI family transcriptional regulator [Clostridia bacterium]|jgi:DNA-binding LacI/PurR family transcriptional regulator|nr:LacI family transcriptional regulator [Clostridia bacterium]
MTIYDIAKIAGVSASTVSRVINNKEGIKKETRERIKKLLEEHHYIPDENARGLVNKATRLIGILVVDIRNAHHTDLAYVVEKFLRGNGYCCIILNAGEGDYMMAETIRILGQRRVDGVLLVGSMFQNQVVEGEIKEHLPNIPIVIANGYIKLPNVYGVLVDECEGVKHCVDLLYSKGRRRIAFVVKMFSPSSNQKLRGYIKGMKEHSYLEKDLVVVETDNTLEKGYEATKRLVEEYPGVDGIIYSEDTIAAGGMRAFLDLGIKIPEQVSVIGIDNTIYGELCYPKLTSLDNKMIEMGLTASRILIDTIEGNNHPEKIMLFSKVIEREST